MTATRMLRQQHRDIEQELALLETLAFDCESEFAALMVDLTAHLAAEASVFHGAAEEALGRPLAEQRKHHERLREAALQAARATGDATAFARSLFHLAEAFKAHSRSEERALHGSLEGALGDRQLEALGAKLAAHHSAVSRSLRGAARGRPRK
jgi:hypothetical protein